MQFIARFSRPWNDSTFGLVRTFGLYTRGEVIRIFLHSRVLVLIVPHVDSVKIGCASVLDLHVFVYVVLHQKRLRAALCVQVCIGVGRVGHKLVRLVHGVRRCYCDVDPRFRLAGSERPLKFVACANLRLVLEVHVHLVRTVDQIHGELQLEFCQQGAGDLPVVGVPREPAEEIRFDRYDAVRRRRRGRRRRACGVLCGDSVYRRGLV